MKKIAMFIIALAMSITANAQFEQGKIYVGASLTGLDGGTRRIFCYGQHSLKSKCGI